MPSTSRSIKEPLQKKLNKLETKYTTKTTIKKNRHSIRNKSIYRGIKNKLDKLQLDQPSTEFKSRSIHDGPPPLLGKGAQKQRSVHDPNTGTNAVEWRWAFANVTNST